ncbi:PA0069 family radical SAM protein [Herbaspirillum rhizosphaerae]|uniref:PA0069 family radical SAM protein n=1 Tax=Herbaspirillum rhizosphaerae TaxID=346179 RepID=UPI00067C4605|nr:PA0069 family radical SAM protein [Herbaspirillum rhizosphaerae]
MAKSTYRPVPLQTTRTLESAGETFSQVFDARKGRGAVSNIQGRYETEQRVGFDDGWGAGEEEGQGGEPDTLRTIVTEEVAKTIISRNKSPDLPFNVSLNPYRGCEHGCVYCFARPTHAYLGLSPGLDFESRIFAKVNAPELLRKELAKPSYVAETITVGINTDAYQPCERELQITRRVLQVLDDCRHPAALITKSSLIERDVDILAAMASRRQVIAAVTIATLDPALARKLEPRAATPTRRLRVIRTLTDAGIPVSVSIAPIIPFINEPELESIVAAAAEAGARRAGYTVLRLPWEVNPLFQQWLLTHFPERANRVMNRIREMRGGKDNDSDFATRMRGEGVWADLIRQRFDKAVQRSAMHQRGWFDMLDASQFVPPARPPRVSLSGQFNLF